MDKYTGAGSHIAKNSIRRFSLIYSEQTPNIKDDFNNIVNQFDQSKFRICVQIKGTKLAWNEGSFNGVPMAPPRNFGEFIYAS